MTQSDEKYLHIFLDENEFRNAILDQLKVGQQYCSSPAPLLEHLVGNTLGPLISMLEWSDAEIGISPDQFRGAVQIYNALMEEINLLAIALSPEEVEKIIAKPSDYIHRKPGCYLTR